MIAISVEGGVKSNIEEGKIFGAWSCHITTLSFEF
jgi:hypothetical protein